jgi:hypothetical protein
MCALLGYYTAYGGDSLPMILTLEDGTDMMSRNLGKELPLYAM